MGLFAAEYRRQAGALRGYWGVYTQQGHASLALVQGWQDSDIGEYRCELAWPIFISRVSVSRSPGAAFDRAKPVFARES